MNQCKFFLALNLAVVSFSVFSQNCNVATVQIINNTNEPITNCTNTSQHWNGDFSRLNTGRNAYILARGDLVPFINMSCPGMNFTARFGANNNNPNSCQGLQDMMCSVKSPIKCQTIGKTGDYLATFILSK